MSRERGRPKQLPQLLLRGPVELLKRMRVRAIRSTAAVRGLIIRRAHNRFLLRLSSRSSPTPIAILLAGGATRVAVVVCHFERAGVRGRGRRCRRIVAHRGGEVRLLLTGVRTERHHHSGGSSGHGGKPSSSSSSTIAARLDDITVGINVPRSGGGRDIAGWMLLLLLLGLKSEVVLRHPWGRCRRGRGSKGRRTIST